MFENINDLTIKGGCFGEETTLKGIFSERINIVYGPNGSGKSTLSRAMADLAYDLDGKTYDRRGSATVLFNGEQKAALKGRLYVYNEDFVDRNVKVDEGLNGIVMLGEENIANDNEKKVLEHEKQTLTVEREGLLKERDGDAGTGTDSLAQLIAAEENDLINALKAQNGYAERGRDIKGLTNRLQVKLDDFDGIEANVGKFDTNVANVAAELNRGINELQTVNGGEAITWSASIENTVDIDGIDRLLQKTIQRVELDDEWLKELAETSISTIEAAKESIVEKGLTRRPYYTANSPSRRSGGRHYRRTSDGC